MTYKKFNLRERVGFSASIEEQPLAVAAGTYIHNFYLGLKADLATGTTVPLTSFLGLLSSFQYRVNGVPRINLGGRDIFALDALFFGYVPYAIQGAAGEDDKVLGMMVPIGHIVKANEAVSWLASRTAVTNVSGEIISVAYDVKDAGRYSGAFDIRVISGTSPPSTGKTTIVPDLPRVGKLLGILLFSNTVPTSTADSTTLQKLELYRNDVLEVTAEWLELAPSGRAAIDSAVGTAIRDVVNPYAVIDMRDDPWDLTRDRARLDALIGVANDAYRVIPIYQL